MKQNVTSLVTMTFDTAPPPTPLRIASPSLEEEQLASEAALTEPSWVYEKRDEWGEHFTLPEWQDDHDTQHEGYRAKHGWKVSDKKGADEDYFQHGYFQLIELYVCVIFLFRAATTSIAVSRTFES